MPLWMMVAAGFALFLLAVLVLYVVARYYETSYDRTYMTQDERGFKRALRGKGVIWDFEEKVVKGATAPQIEFVAIDAATGGRRAARLLDARTGAINLRPQYCAPLPFQAVTADGHKLVVEARVQFSLNRDLLKHVYEIQEFSLALETRIHSAFRAEIGKRADEQLRASLHEVERSVIEFLRQAEADGDQEGERGMALGVNFHTASFSYNQPDEFAPMALPMSASGGGPGLSAEAQRAMRTQGVLALRPQQLDQLADVFRNRDGADVDALLAILEMQTRQNIAEALANSGQLVVVTAQELGLTGLAAQRDAITRFAARDAGQPVITNGRGEHRP